MLLRPVPTRHEGGGRVASIDSHSVVAWEEEERVASDCRGP